MNYTELKKKIEEHRATTIAEYSEEISAEKASELYAGAWANSYDEIFELIDSFFVDEIDSSDMAEDDEDDEE